MNQILGWKEWVELPQLGIPPIKAKIDTGAKTSSLHAENIESFSKDGDAYVRFSTNFGIENSKSITCECPVLIKERWSVLQVKVSCAMQYLPKSD